MRPALLTIACVMGLISIPSFGQSLTLAEVTATGAKPLSVAEAREAVSGATTEFALVNGSTRSWTNNADGTLVASRSNGAPNRRSGRGTWSINDDAAYCLTFDWGAMETESWCRRLYKVEDRFYAYSLEAKPDTRSGRYRFSK